jgi:hypothetical protein
MSRLLWRIPPLNKLAIFVEGYTEVLFVDRLISEIGGAHKVLIEQMKIRGGSSVRRAWSFIKAAKPATGQKFYILLVDCGGEDLVKSRIRVRGELIHSVCKYLKSLNMILLI